MRDFCNLSFLCFGDDVSYHSVFWRLASGSKGKSQLSSSVTIIFKWLGSSSATTIRLELSMNVAQTKSKSSSKMSLAISLLISSCTANIVVVVVYHWQQSTCLFPQFHSPHQTHSIRRVVHLLKILFHSQILKTSGTLVRD